MTMLVLGPEGTFSHELAYRVFGSDITLVPTIQQIFSGVVKGRCEGLVPLENSEAGGVGASLDGFLGYPVYIRGELFMPIHHYLVSFVPLDAVDVIYVHPQTHEQCSRLIEALSYPVIHTASNAASAKAVLESRGSAAIVSMMAARLYQIPVRRECVENNPQNVTRFVTISSSPAAPAGPGKCSIVVDPREDRAGLLHGLLTVFAERGINLTRIESRPSKRGIGSYVFFIDFEHTPADSEAMEMLQDLARVKYLGCYGEIEVPTWR
ncbi:MAG TPA: prephenate dehydratase domain-containing protein [Methanoregulaceae archaeon]|nr:prephenate dehydratase domain-containing protein [Methanoregulaceae archaeon]HPQ76795.1 prephenate dehydratase domain-containing protein [Methanoregulaceae archaeon]